MVAEPCSAPCVRRHELCIGVFCQTCTKKIGENDRSYGGRLNAEANALEKTSAD
jgi:hypothetical protein